jgi:MinD superfamily P-loop ATPase
MKIAIASGKGGTGKTLFSVSFAKHLLSKGISLTLVDCDVEEPNAHLFFPELNYQQEPVTTPIPQVDESRCTNCGVCSEACAFNALLVLKKVAVVYNHLCHSCGVCKRVCPEDAISYVPYEVGWLEHSVAPPLHFTQGKLKIGEASGVPIIKKAKLNAVPTDLLIFDSPPGISCPVVTTLEGMDFVILITEPTPFGLHDLKLAVELVRTYSIPFGVVINQVGIGDQRVQEYCQKDGISILAEIPHHRGIATGYAEGKDLLESYPQIKHQLEALYVHLREYLNP